ncbi:MAG TPA: prolyl oligopeptidase family serine peptidase [Candidatus Limnocylindria bacterium]|nr:prolyl oligopeptidase family serine peptidase [Candidatus Limnocylindria bacterium]
MTKRPTRPYGTWPSPISIEMAVAGSVALREPRLDRGDVYWTEGRPEERGRQVVVRWSEADGRRDALAPDFNARTMAHEYGGGAYAVSDGWLYFSNLADGRIYRQRPGESEAKPITPEGPYRYADLLVDEHHGRLLAVREDHTPVQEAAQPAAGSTRGPEPENSLVAISLSEPAAERPVQVLAAGRDFYSSPRPSPDGSHLAWLSWSHPNMPWDASELWLAGVEDDGSLADARRVAGEADESIVQPEWAPDGRLVYVSDRSGWWNLYALAVPQRDGDAAQPLAPMEAEFAAPQWVFGMTWYDVADDGTIVAVAHRAGRDELWMVPPKGQPERVQVPDEQIWSLRVEGRRLAYLGASAVSPNEVVLLDLDADQRRSLRRAYDLEVPPEYISRPQQITFPTSGGKTAHALYYAPVNPDVEPPPTERPPLVVMSHGGPTSSAWSGLSLATQVFTSRGFAVVDVDYGGSSGYGREYMRRLDGQWGVVDVEDCINAARHLADSGEVDGQRMAIRGGSAGGFTTLCGLIFHDVFAAGASHFGVGDLEALARDTHKFESRYLDRLVAPYPEQLELYRQRSPIHFAKQCGCPVIVFQGLDDKVVPVAQAEELVDALRRNNLPHAYLAFEGEGHGFRRAENIRRALEAELSFYAQIFGFELADDIEPVPLS